MLSGVTMALMASLLAADGAGCRPSEPRMHAADGFKSVGQTRHERLVPLDVEALFDRMIVIDGNASYYSPRTQIGQPNFETDENGQTVKQSTGIDFGSMSLNAKPAVRVGDEAYAREKRRFDIGYYSGARLILTADDFDLALKSGEYGALFYTQVHYQLHGSIDNIQRWYDDGLRIFQIAYGSGSNQEDGEKLGNGTDEVGGLTELGKRVIDELIRLGIVIDVSHCNEQTILETAAIAIERGVPITANHTVAYALRIDDRFTRGASDKAMRAIADTGGVVGIMTYGPWIVRDPRGGDATIDDYIAHLLHAIGVVGIDNVGLATDGYLDGSWPAGRTSGDGIIDCPDRWKQVVRALYERERYGEKDFENLLGGNFLRVYREILTNP